MARNTGELRPDLDDQLTLCQPLRISVKYVPGPDPVGSVGLPAYKGERRSPITCRLDWALAPPRAGARSSKAGHFPRITATASAPTDLFGCICIGRGPEAKPEKFAPPELSKVELEARLTGPGDCVPVRWASGPPVLGAQEKGQTSEAGFARLCMPGGLHHNCVNLLALQQRKGSNRAFRPCLYRPRA